MSGRNVGGAFAVAAILVSCAIGGACAQAPRPVAPATDAAGSAKDARGQVLSGLYFDPDGADFAPWVNRFKDEAYRNWAVPHEAISGTARGHVDLEFTVERDGSMSALRLIKSSGMASLDRAAQDALTSCRLLQLPSDYGPPRVRMLVSFYYNESPSRRR